SGAGIRGCRGGGRGGRVRARGRSGRAAVLLSADAPGLTPPGPDQSCQHRQHEQEKQRAGFGRRSAGRLWGGGAAALNRRAGRRPIRSTAATAAAAAAPAPARAARAAATTAATAATAAAAAAATAAGAAAA